ncbi:4-carboxy-4-hydroxy-2-oxoadipate aldolase/oxaloacetate decarboxylase [Micromonospora sp. NBC_01699]|uniref:RraA family protein n=1 Tax=Micromonospora sp. NBC_01699 TaxID=2975984 RepID=UPI002E2F0E83|nr:4-carboxy-4-hydroxy-2-oxoadipate aldolase/oxaloacetate decarboxylase [Micromonospora sp. NBC_01699]
MSTPDRSPVDQSVLVDRLRQLDTCAISDALDTLGIVGVPLGPRPVWPVRRVVAGLVRTVQAGPRRSDGPADHIAAAAVDRSGPLHVLVIANEGRTDVSCWGGILSRAAVNRSIAGVVIDGACRDAGESDALDFPVFARAVVPVSARGRVVQLSMDEPVAFGDLWVAPGDYVIADVNGVAFVPAGYADLVIDLAERIVAREADMAAAVDEGRPVSVVMHDSQFPTVESDRS